MHQLGHQSRGGGAISGETRNSGVINFLIQPLGSIAVKPSRIQSNVTGTVWKIMVAVGDAVVADQELLILESMKMEIPASAAGAGRVHEILVAEGEAVLEGQDLIVIIAG